MRRVATASLAGATLEWYDFQLYGWLAALAFNKLFFPAEDPLVGTLVAFLSFGVGFVMRPVGALVFGHLGDKLGRKSTLLISLSMVGVPTVLTGLLPTYDSIGIWAPILLVFFRLLQGLGLGGEWAGASLLVVEHAPQKKRGSWGSFPGLGNPMGQLLSIVVVFGFVAALSEEQFLTWGWRMPYLLSFVILIAGFYVRRQVGETPSFERMRRAQQHTRMPLRELFRRYPTTILKAAGTRIADGGNGAVFLVFGISYATTQLGLSKSVATLGVVIALAGQILVIPLAGRLSDRIGRRPVLMIGTVAIAAAIFPSFMLINTAQPFLVCLAFFIGFPVGCGMVLGPIGAYLPELFHPSVRFSGTSVVFQLSSLGFGFVPAIAAALLVLGGGSPWLVCGFVVLLAAVQGLCIYLLPETYRRSLENDNEKELS